MKILVISDTHNRISAALSAVRRHCPTHIVHLGDMAEDARQIGMAFPGTPVLCVRGNNDFLVRIPYDIVTEIDGMRLFFTHGHKYGVKSGTDTLARHAASLGVQYAFFGHTHSPHDTVAEGVRLLNPSSHGYILLENHKVEVYKY